MDSGPHVRDAGTRGAVAQVEFRHRQLRQQPASVDHDDVVRGGLDLVQQMGGDQHGSTGRGEIAQEAAQPADAFWVQAVRRLIQDQIIGIAEHRGSQRQALPHAHGVLPDRLAGDVAQANLAEQLVDSAITGAGRGREHTKVIATSPRRVEARVEHASDSLLRMRQVGVGEFAKGCRTRRRGSQADQDPHRGGLPRAIGTQEAGHASRLDDEAQIVYGEGAVVALDQPVDDDRRHFMINDPT